MWACGECWYVVEVSSGQKPGGGGSAPPSLGRWQRLVLRAVALNTYHEKRSRAARRRMGATDSDTTARSVILPSEQAIAEGGGFNVRVGRHCVIFQCRRPCARLVPVLKRAAWTSYGEIGHEATEYEPWRGRDQRGAVQSATQTNRRRIPCWGQERQQDLFFTIGPIGQSEAAIGQTGLSCRT